MKKKLEKSIKEYCKENNIENFDDFIDYLIEKAFLIEKYGIKPSLTEESKANIDIKPINKEIKVEAVKKTASKKRKVTIIKNDLSND